MVMHIEKRNAVFFISKFVEKKQRNLYFHILYSTRINKIFLSKQKTQYPFQFELDRFSKRQLEK